MTEPIELIRKLQIKAGTRLWLFNVPPAISDAITAGAEVEIARKDEPADGALVFCDSPADVEVAAQAIGALPPDAMLWFAYRKGSAAKASGLSRDVGWTALDALGLRPVRSVAIDDDWTGLRFRPKEVVKAARAAL